MVVSRPGWGQAAVEVPASDGDQPEVLDFVGTLADPSTTTIDVAAVRLEPGPCPAWNTSECGTGFTCGTGECVPHAAVCDGVPDCGDEADEYVPECGKYSQIPT